MAGDGGDVKEVGCINKSADESTNNDAVLSDDSELIISVAINEVILLKSVIYFTCNVASGIRIALNGPAATTSIRSYAFMYDSTGAISSGIAASYGIYALLIGGISGHCIIESTIENGANAGNIAVQWAQHTSNANNTTVERGSYIKWYRL